MKVQGLSPQTDERTEDLQPTLFWKEYNWNDRHKIVGLLLLVVGPISPGNLQSLAEVIDQKYASVIDPRSSFSDRGLSHRTFDQVIDTKIWLVVGPRSLVLGNQRLLVLN